MSGCESMSASKEPSTGRGCRLFAPLQMQQIPIKLVRWQDGSSNTEQERRDGFLARHGAALSERRAGIWKQEEESRCRRRHAPAQYSSP